MTAVVAAPPISNSMKEQFQREGYFILEKAIPEETLQMLREECSYFLGYMDAEMDAADPNPGNISHRGRRYFIANRYRLSQRVHRFLFGALMAEVCRAALGDEAQLFFEQWVVKGAERGMKFAWHQDSGYVKFNDKKTVHRPYLTCWCPLDDVSEANGTVYLLPHSRGGTSHTVFDHKLEEGTNDLIGYTGSDPGIPIVVPAGSVVAFTSYNFHRSGPNTTDKMRRVYLAQYSAEPILNSAGKVSAMAVPFLKGGRNVYDHVGDTAEKYGPKAQK